MESEAGADQEGNLKCRSEEDSLSSQVVWQLEVFMCWDIFHHSEVTSEPDSSAKQRPQTTLCVSSAFRFATATNICQNLTLKVLVAGMKGNENGKLRHTGAACLQTDLCNFKGNRSFSAPLINSEVCFLSRTLLYNRGKQHPCLKLWASDLSAR